MADYGGVSGELLRTFVERIEKLEEEKKFITDNIKDVFAEAKAQGYDVKTMRQVIRLRKLQPAEYEENEYLLDTYKHALGMLPGEVDNQNADTLS